MKFALNLACFISLFLIHSSVVCAEATPNNTGKPDYSGLTIEGLKTAPTTPAKEAGAALSSSMGTTVSHPEVDTSKYENQTNDQLGAVASAADGAKTQEANGKLVLAEKFAILNNAPCEEITSIANAGESKAAEMAGQTAATLCQKLRAQVKSCDSIFTGAIGVSNLCHTEKNESISSTVTMIQAIMATAGSIVNACNDFGKAMNLAQKGMTAYTMACGAAQVACKIKCSGAKTAVQEFETAAQKLVPKMIAACKQEQSLATAQNNAALASSIGTHCNLVGNEIKKFVSTHIAQDNQAAFGVRAKAEICVVNVPSLLMSGLVGIASFANAKSKSDQCKADAEAKKQAEIAANSCENAANKDRADCSCAIQANKKLSYCATGLVDCGLSENADKPLCICKANPRMKGCEGVSTSIATNSALNNGDTSGLTSRKPGSLTNTPTTATDASGGFPKDKAGNGQDGTSNLSNTAGGGSSAGLSADGGGSSADGGGKVGATDKTAAAAASKDSANILESSSGGGGGFRAFGGGSYSSPEYRSRLKAFANSNGIGAKIAGSSWGDQVTTTGGKSNFEKVKTRYQENKASLLSK